MIRYKKYLLTLLFILLFAYPFILYSSVTKGFQIGLKTGYNYTIPIYSMNNLFIKPKIHYQPKQQLGLSNEVELSQKLSIVVEVFHEKRLTHVSRICSYGPEIYPYAFKLNYTLVSLPILLKINFFQHTYSLTGVRFQNILKAEEDFADCGGFYQHENVSSKMPNSTFAFELGIGKEILL